MDKLKVLIHSNGSRAVTGFGKNMKNILLALYKDPNIELIEAANGYRIGMDLKTPWESSGTYPSNPALLAKIKGDGIKERAASYGFYCIDEIIERYKPDVYLGIEDIWAFTEFQTKPWWNKIPCIIWTTLDSLPILPQAEHMAPKTDKFFVWASFAEKALKQKGFNVKTLHGAVDYNHFYKLPDYQRRDLRIKNGLNDCFVVGFVFKNQLRKSAPNLLDGFRIFKENNPTVNAKLIFHSDWREKGLGWDLPKYVEEKGVAKEDVLATYICKRCKEYQLLPYEGEEKNCSFCGGEKQLETKTTNHGCSDRQLNEIYNIMDVYCHPFTSGGQELPIQEAKSAGLITLVTDYSCGEDAVGPNTGGIPLKWSEYREPGTDFIKATTCPISIAENLKKVLDMDENSKKELSNQAINYVAENYSVQSVVDKLKKELLEFNKSSWDFNMNKKDYNVDYNPPETEDDLQWLLDVYLGITYKKLTPLDPEIKVGLQLIQKDGRGPVLNFIKEQARNKNSEKETSVSFESLLGDEGPDKRIAVIIPESAGDVLIINGLIKNLSELYPNDNIYVITKPSYYCMINDNPYVYKILPYQDGLDNLLYLEGRGDHQGFFKCAFLPHVGTQRVLNYLHNGEERNQFNLFENVSSSLSLRERFRG